MNYHLSDREDVDKDHIIQLNNCNAKVFFLKESIKTEALRIVEDLLLDSYEKRTYAEV